MDRNRFLAVIDCREGIRLGHSPNGPYWEPRFVPCTLSEEPTEAEALRVAREACDASPRDCRNPRVELR